jgi:UDP-3-O-[3-hydroxymyristoyl] glucosamine N-acyltransferase
MKLSDLAEHLGLGEIPEDYELSDILALSDAFGRGKDTLTWISDAKLEGLELPLACTVICSETARANPLLAQASLLVVSNPRSAFRLALQLFSRGQEDSNSPRIADSAYIHPGSKIGPNVSIGRNVVIESGVLFGDCVCIGHNSVIIRNTVIGSHVKIGSNCTIGGVGFGYEKNDEGLYEVLPHLGNVVIEDHVEIGNNTCIDRAVLGSTVIRANAKVDNLVHIAHGCDIGRNALIIANAMIAGSVKIGENAWIAPSSSILNQKTVSANTVIGIGSVVLKDVKAGDAVFGNPARSIRLK